jgi:hypothetical protein
MWKLSTIDNELNFHNFIPISLLDVTTKELVFGEEDIVLILLIYRGTNQGKKSSCRSKLGRLFAQAHPRSLFPAQAFQEGVTFLPNGQLDENRRD